MSGVDLRKMMEIAGFEPKSTWTSVVGADGPPEFVRSVVLELFVRPMDQTIVVAELAGDGFVDCEIISFTLYDPGVESYRTGATLVDPVHIRWGAKERPSETRGRGCRMIYWLGYSKFAIDELRRIDARKKKLPSRWKFSGSLSENGHDIVIVGYWKRKRALEWPEEKLERLI